MEKHICRKDGKASLDHECWCEIGRNHTAQEHRTLMGF